MSAWKRQAQLIPEVDLHQEVQQGVAVSIMLVRTMLVLPESEVPSETVAAGCQRHS